MYQIHMEMLFDFKTHQHKHQITTQLTFTNQYNTILSLSNKY